MLRLGLGSVRGVGEATAERIVAGTALARRRGPGAPGRRHRRPSSRRWPPPGRSIPRSDEGDAQGTTATRRRLLWAAGAAAQGTPDRLPGIVVGAEAPPLPEPSLYDSVGDDLWALGLAPERTAMHLARERLEAMGVTDGRRPGGLPSTGTGSRVAGVVTHRQHPETARGAVFVNLEDETGHVNVVFSQRRLGPLEARGPAFAGAVDPRPGAQGAGRGQLRCRAGRGARRGDGGAGEPRLPLRVVIIMTIWLVR